MGEDDTAKANPDEQAESQEDTASAGGEAAKPAPQEPEGAEQPGEEPQSADEAPEKVPVQPAEFEDLADEPQGPGPSLDLVLDISMPVTVELGRAIMTVRELLGLRSGDPLPGTENQKDEPRKLVPVFTLLATVKDPHGYCAVIQSETSKVSVVEVGDTLDGFRIERIGGSHAVLTDGRDTIIARRPRS